MIKKVYIIILVLTFCLLSQSCGSKSKDNEIYFLNFKPEIAEKYNEISKVYQEETGIKVKFSTAASNSYEQTLKSEIAKKDAPVIFQINGPVGYRAWKNYCADMSNTKFYTLLSDKDLAITASDGGVYGIPYVIEGYGIICNLEKFNEYFSLQNRQTSINSFEEITDFTSLKTVVEDMTKNIDRLSIDGVFGSTSMANGEDWRWQTHLSNIPFYLEKSKYNYDPVTGVDEISFEFNRNMKDLFDLYINNSVTDRKLLGSKTVADSMAEFALGQCAMIQNGNWAWSQINEVAGNTVNEDDIRFLPLYTGSDNEKNMGICIGTENYLCINSQASDEKKKMADDFLYWLFSSETGKKFVINELDFLTPFNSFSISDTPNDPLAKEIFKWQNTPGIDNVEWDFVIYPSTDFKADFGSKLLSYAQGTSTWDDVVNTVITRWREESQKAN